DGLILHGGGERDGEDLDVGERKEFAEREQAGISGARVAAGFLEGGFERAAVGGDAGGNLMGGAQFGRVGGVFGGRGDPSHGGESDVTKTRRRRFSLHVRDLRGSGSGQRAQAKGPTRGRYRGQGGAGGGRPDRGRRSHRCGRG